MERIFFTHRYSRIRVMKNMADLRFALLDISLLKSRCAPNAVSISNLAPDHLYQMGRARTVREDRRAYLPAAHVMPLLELAYSKRTSRCLCLLIHINQFILWVHVEFHSYYAKQTICSVSFLDLLKFFCGLLNIYGPEFQFDWVRCRRYFALENRSSKRACGAFFAVGSDSPASTDTVTLKKTNTGGSVYTHRSQPGWTVTRTESLVRISCNLGYSVIVTQTNASLLQHEPVVESQTVCFCNTIYSWTTVSTSVIS